MTVFVTVGSERFPFDRLVRAVDSAVESERLRAEVRMQIGCSTYRPRSCRWYRFVPFRRLIQLIAESDVVVSHAGVGSTILCIEGGKTPLLVPRRARYGEHLDDHQVRFAREIAARTGALVVRDESELIQLLGSHYYPPAVSTQDKSQQDLGLLVERLHTLVHASGGGLRVLRHD